jgi:hypothetical protein
MKIRPSGATSLEEQQGTETAKKECKKLSRYRALCHADQFSFLYELDFPSCKSHTHNGSSYCCLVSEQQAIVDQAIQNAVRDRSLYDSAKNQLQAYNESSEDLRNILTQIHNQIELLKETSPKKLAHVAASAAGSEMTQEELDANWMSFNFDTETSEQSLDAPPRSSKLPFL